MNGAETMLKTAEIRAFCRTGKTHVRALGLLLFFVMMLTGLQWSVLTALAQQTVDAAVDHESEPDLGGLLAATKKMTMMEVEPGLSVGTADYPPFGIRIHVFDFSNDRFDVRVGEQTRATGSDVAEFFAGRDDVFVVNGGYFERSSGGKLSSSGLLLVDGQITSREHQRAGSGVIYSDTDGVRIIYRKDFSAGSSVRYALQAGPILVDPGGVKGIYKNVGGRHNRSAICLRNGAFTAFVVEGGISLFQLADLLSLPSSDGGFGCEVAINLDGGPSTQAALRAGSTNRQIVGGSTVHNALIVARRPKG